MAAGTNGPRSKNTKHAHMSNNTGIRRTRPQIGAHRNEFYRHRPSDNFHMIQFLQSWGKVPAPLSMVRTTTERLAPNPVKGTGTNL